MAASPEGRADQRGIVVLALLVLLAFQLHLSYQAHPERCLQQLQGQYITAGGFPPSGAPHRITPLPLGTVVRYAAPESGDVICRVNRLSGEAALEVPETAGLTRWPAAQERP